MHRKSNCYLGLFAVVALMSLTAGIVSAAPVSQSITYQGKLTNAAGSPLTGTYSVRFSLYEAANGGTAIASSTQSVPCSGGLFTTPIAFSQEYFDGRALWLGVRVGSDPEMTPRQEVRPVSYALGLRPGAVITGDASTNPSLKVINTGPDTAALIAGTTGTNSPAVFAGAMGTKSPAVYAMSQNDIGVYGESSYNTGIYGKGKEGGYFTTRQAGDFSNQYPGVNVSTTFAYNPGVQIRTTGQESYGVTIVTESPFSDGIQVKTSDKNSDGFDSHTAGDYSYGVNAFTTGDSSYGVRVLTIGDDSAAVYALTTGANSPGVFAGCDSSEGIIGKSWSKAGVKGESEYKAGVWGFSENDVGLYAVTNRSDDRYGIFTPDYLYAKGTVVPNVDVAEYMPAAGDLSPGTVVIIGDGGKLEESSTAYDTRAAGIVSTEPGVILGTKVEGNAGEAQIAIAGRVPCRVDASKASIHAGDLLTTSDNPGYAMKAVPDIINGHKYYPDGTVLGKAMGTLESGTGTIEVLVTLQ